MLVRIRGVQAEELRGLVPLFMRAYEGLEHYGERSRGEGARYLEVLFEDCPEGFLLAEALGEVVGFISSDPHWQDGKKGTVLEVHELVVHPDWQGKGIATDLMEAALDIGRTHKRNGAALWVGVGNSYAREWYRSMGFGEVGRAGKWIRMYRPLGDATHRSSG